MDSETDKWIKGDSCKIPYKSGLCNFFAIHQECKESCPLGVNPFPVLDNVAAKDAYHTAFVLRLTFHI